MVIVEDKIRMPIESFKWHPEIVEPGYKITGKLFGDRAEALQLNWPSTSMPELIEVFNEETGRRVRFRQRGILHSQDRYYSLNPDYLIEIYFIK
jgi:hypothetical protein